MLQQVMTAPGKIGFHEVPVPEISEGEVLIKIMKIGICGSDIHVYHGEHPFTSYPVTQGHEVSGEVVKTGTAVSGIKPGQKVVVESSTRKMLGIVALVYAIPVALFLLGYVGALVLGAGVGVQYTAAILGFAMGILFAIRYDRRLRARGGLSFTIVRLF